MKQRRFLLILVCLLTLLPGCRPREEAPPLHLEQLTVELSREGLSVQALMDAVKTLPPQLAACFENTEVEIGEIRVTVGASPVDTASALDAGSVQLAFLPAADLLSSELELPVLLADAHHTATTTSEAGTTSLICAAPSPYGLQLSRRAESSAPLTWEELSAARWGVLGETSLGGYQCFDLWLSDHYEGSRVADLPQVTVYDSYEVLLRAAAAEEIDALVLQNDLRSDLSDAWTLSDSRTSDGGVRGFGRTAPIQEELKILAVSDRVFTHVAAVSPTEEALSDPRFLSALSSVLTQMAQEFPEQMTLLGAEQFFPVSDADLDPTRRLTTLF